MTLGSLGILAISFALTSGTATAATVSAQCSPGTFGPVSTDVSLAATQQTCQNFQALWGGTVPTGSTLNSVTLRITINETVTSLTFDNTGGATQNFTYVTKTGVTLGGTAPAADLTAIAAGGGGLPSVGSPFTLYQVGSGFNRQSIAPGEFIQYLPTQTITPSGSTAIDGSLITGTGSLNFDSGSITSGTPASYNTTGTFTLAYATSGTVSGGGGAGNITIGQSTTTSATFSVIYDYTAPAAPSLSILKAHSGTFIPGGASGSGNFTLTVSNAGPGTTSGQVTVNDPFPVGLTPGTATSPGNAWACTTTVQTVNCTITQVVASGGSYPVITVPVSVPLGTVAGNLTNTVTQTGGGDPGTHTSPDTVSIPGPSLSILKAHSGTFIPGGVSGSGNFTLTVSNAGPAPTNGQVTVNDPFPAGLTPGTATSPGNAWACTTTVQTVNCTITQSVASGGSYPVITVPVSVPLGTAAGNLLNTVTQTGGGDPGTHTSPDTVSIPGPSLSILKAHSGTFIPGGASGSGNFTLTVSNAGPAPTNGQVTVNDPFPVGLTPGNATSPGNAWACTTTVQTVNCTITQSVPAGGSYPVITVPVAVPGGTPAGNLLNTATQTGGGDPNTHTSPDTVSVTLAPPPPPPSVPDMTITKSHTGAFVQGQTAVYTVIASNVGTIATSGTVSVVDSLPTGLTATAISGAGWTCTLGNLTCTRSDTLLNGASYPAITVNVNIAANAPAYLVNLATVSGGGETNLSNDTASDPAVIVSVPDMTITKSHTGNFTQGQVGATYTVVASNIGAVATSGQVSVVDTLPTGLTATAIAGSGWSCTLASLTCTRSDVLASNAAYPAITVTVNVALNAPPTVINTATVSGGGEVNLTNDVANDPATLKLLPDMTITKSHTGNFTLGEIGATYTLTASNVGTGPTVGTVTVTDSVPTGLTLTGMAGSGWTCSGATCSRGDVLAPGTAYPPITVTVNVAINAPSTMTNTGVVGGGGEQNTSNNTAIDPTVIVGVPDMTITKSHVGNFAPGQVGAVYTVTASNIGPVATNGVVTVTDTLPTGLTATAIGGTGWTCTLASLSCTRSDVLAPAGIYPAITVTVNVAANPPSTLINTAVVGGGGETNTSNDTATDPTVIKAVPDMTITKSHTGTFTRSGTGTYTLTASNVGTVATTGAVSVVDTLPTGLTGTAMSGTGWTCTVAMLTCTRSDVLAAGGSYPPITVTVSIASNAPSTLVNTAVVGGGGETNTANDTATDPTSIVDAPSLSLSKTHVGAIAAGSPGNYLLTVTNSGTTATSAPVTVTDTLPSYLTAVTMSGSGWTCTVASVSCTRSDVLAAGASFPAISLIVNVASNAPSSVVNVATAIGGGGVSAPASASDSATSTTLDPTLVITKTADRATADTGEVVGYRITATNNHATAILSAVINDKLPPGFDYVAGSSQLISGAAGSQPIDPGNIPGTLTFNLGTMAPQATDTITYRVRISAKAHTGDNINTAQLTGLGSVGNPLNSPPATARVTVGSGLLSLRQFIIGRVYEDVNGNGIFDKDDRPVAGARVYISNGQSASTDSKGLYNIPSVNPGSVTISIDPATLPKGYTLSDEGLKDGQSWSRLLRTPLGGGIMLRQNFVLKPCAGCTTGTPISPSGSAGGGTVVAPAGVGGNGAAPQAAGSPRVEITPQQTTVSADGRTATLIEVRVVDAKGAPMPVEEIRIKTTAGQFVKDDGPTPMFPGTKSLAQNNGPANLPGTTNQPGALLFGAHTETQMGQTTEQVPERLQVSTVRPTQGEATFLLMSPHTPGFAHLEAETGDPEHRISGFSSIEFVPEKRSPILVGVGELSIGRAAPEFELYGQSGEVARHGDVFMRALYDEYLFTAAYTSHLPINNLNGVNQMFQQDPLDRVYPVFGDSSTQYQTAQSNSHLYARIERQLSYIMFGDLRGDTAQKNIYGASDFARNLTGVQLHLEDQKRDGLTLEGARPNTAFARDSFPGSTFGLIQLTHPDVLPGSETVTLETRDRYNPEIVISREPLVRSADYTLDWNTGVIYLLRSLNIFDQALNLNQLVVTYEYKTIGLSSSVYGLRASTGLTPSGTRVGLSLTNERGSGVGSYYLGGVQLQQNLPLQGKLQAEFPLSYGSALAAGFSSSSTGGQPSDVNGKAIRAELMQPLPFLSARFQANFSETDRDFYNPFGVTTLPGSRTTRTSITFVPIKGTSLKLGFTDERNKTDLVNNQRNTGSLELKQSLGEYLKLTVGYDYRDFQDALLSTRNQANEVSAGLDWKVTKRLTASARREENLTTADPTYPNQTILSARYQVNDTVRLFLTQRLSSAPIIPIGDLSNTGLAALSSKNDTSIGIEDRWNKFATFQGRYLVENGINGSDSYAVIGLVNRIPLQEHLNLDLGMERGTLITGKDGSFNSGSVGFSWLPNKRFKTSTRYEVRDRGGFGQIFTAGAAGRVTDGVTVLGQFQHASANFSAAPGTIDLYNVQQSVSTQGMGALAWRPLKSDRTGLLFSYTLRNTDLSATQTQSSIPEHDHVGILSTDGYWQATRRLEFYGKFAFSDRSYSYDGTSFVSTLTYLTQGRLQYRFLRRFDAAAEARTLSQPDTSTNQWTAGAELGFWPASDLRVALGYNFKSADEISANFLTNPVRQGVYFVISSKLSNMFNLFNPVDCRCAPAAPVAPPPAPKPVANIRIAPITGAHDVCPGENLGVSVAANGWLPEQTPAYQWFIDNRPVPGATGTTLMVPTADGSGMKAIRVTVSAGDVSATSNTVNVLVKSIGMPTIRFSVSPNQIVYGDKLPLAATAMASECAAPPAITYTASEGTIAGATFDSAGVVFDMNNRAKPQSKVIHLTATATDKIGQTVSAPADVTITLTPQARRLDDVVFANNSSRVNNCGKRLLLEELTPMLRDDPNAKVILIGHRDTGEKNNGVDEQRVLNAAAVLSAGQGICPQLDLSRILANWVGTEQGSETRPTMCGSSTDVKERPGQAVAASDQRAQFRRVEIWFVPGGAEVPANLTGLKPVVEAGVKAKGCPR